MKRLVFVLLAACGGSSKPAATEQPPAAVTCAPTGCSGTICAPAGDDRMTTCEMKAEYACYQGAECKVQDSGQCGWTMDDKLTSCLASPPPL